MSDAAVDPTPTAIHEAGHAVMARSLRRGFRRITVAEDEESVGRVEAALPGEWFRPDIEIDGRTRRLIEDRIMIGWAGPEAEAKFTGAYDREGAQGDFSGIVDLACYMTGSGEEASAYAEWLRIRAVAQLGQPRIWQAVEDLAARLTGHVTLSYRQAIRVVDPILFPTAEDVAAWVERVRGSETA